MAKRHHAFLGPHSSWCSACRRVSRRLFRPCLPGRRFLRRHPAGVPGLHHSVHGHPAAARPERIRKAPRPRPHRADDEPHHRAGVVLLLLRAEHLEPSIVNTMHSGMGPLTVVTLAAFGVRLAKTGLSDGGSTSAMPASRCRSWRSLGRALRQFRTFRERHHGAARPRGRFSSAAPSITVSCSIASGCTIMASTPRS